MKSITQDLHVHTALSKCGKSEATVENMLASAEKQGIKTIGFADHCWAKEIPGAHPWYQGQDIEHVLHIKNQIPDNTRGINILVGCETEYIGNGIAGMNKELAQCFDYVMIPPNHFQLGFGGFVRPEDLGSGGPKAVSELLYRRFMEAVELGFGNGFVHPFTPLGFIEWETEVLQGISDTMYKNCFNSAASANIAMEINYGSIWRPREKQIDFLSLYRRIFTIARECGCKFFFGSDAHHPNEITGYETARKFAESCGIDDTMLLVKDAGKSLASKTLFCYP